MVGRLEVMTDIFKIFDLEDKTAVVTGAGRGLGLAMANALSQAGASIAIFDVNMEDAESAAGQIRSSGGAVLAAQIDVTNGEQVQSGIQKVVEAFGGVDILVNDAGVTSRSPF